MAEVSVEAGDLARVDQRPQGRILVVRQPGGDPSGPGKSAVESWRCRGSGPESDPEVVAALMGLA